MESKFRFDSRSVPINYDNFSISLFLSLSLSLPFPKFLSLTLFAPSSFFPTFSLHLFFSFLPSQHHSLQLSSSTRPPTSPLPPQAAAPNYSVKSETMRKENLRRHSFNFFPKLDSFFFSFFWSKISSFSLSFYAHHKTIILQVPQNQTTQH